ncbi:MAG: NAD(P)H-dependent oxidoreductase subunit E [Candidatus Bipolaricaulaceae bacterium]
MARLAHPHQLVALQERLCRERDPERMCITVCGGTGCRAFGGQELAAALQAEVARRNLAGELEVKVTGCHGLCERGPIVVIQPEGVFYAGVQVEDAAELVVAAARGATVDRLLYRDPESGEPVVREEDIPFYRRQQRLVLAGNGRIDPTSIADYIAIGGYQALAKALAQDPEGILEQVEKSGLRGRGGAGFPTGRKWAFTRQAAGQVKYVIANGDEGDPGAYMDRSVLEGNPHRVIEGMAIGAYAVGAREGYLYVRAEYPLAVEHVRTAVAQAEELGLLGDDILGRGFSFHLQVFEGAGAFVCGEETALLASIEGRRGQPRPRPPSQLSGGCGAGPR